MAFTTRNPDNITVNASWLSNNHASLLILLTLILFTSKSLYNLPVAIMAIMGLGQAILTRGRVFTDPLIRAYTYLFLALWLPQLLSLTDAANLGHSLQTVFPYLRFLFMGIYILQERTHIMLMPQLRLAIFCIATFWGIDGCIQYLAGVNLVGYPYEPGHITGMFYPRNTIAHILAALSPLYFESIREYSKQYKWSWLLILPVIVVILLSGRRAAWIMLGISALGYVFFLLRYADISKVARKNLLVVCLVGLITSIAIVVANPTLQDRIIVTVGLFSMDYETADLATARRLPIWETAITVFTNNWINGVGPRGFRHVFQQYSTEDNFWHDSPPTHPHQLLLEILAETGIIGLIGLLAFIWIFYRAFVVDAHLKSRFPLVLSVLIIMFPFSSNLAFYSSYWASVIWWFLLLSFLAIRATHASPTDKEVPR